MTAPIAITGAFGYLGGRFAEHFERQGSALTLLARRRAAGSPEWARRHAVHDLDLSDGIALLTALKGARAVVHLAAMNAGDSARDPEAAYRVNVSGTAALVKAAAAAGARRIIYISTAHVYGAPLRGELDETAPTENTHPYAVTRRRAEEIVLGAEGIEGIVLRVSNSVGPPRDADANCWMLIANDLCRQVATDRALVLHGTGWDQRDFIPVSEVARAISHCLDGGSEVVGEIFNLSAGESMPTLDLAKCIAKRAARILTAPLPIRTAQDDGNRPDIIRLRNAKLAAAGFHIDSDITAEIDAALAFCLKHFGHA